MEKDPNWLLWLESASVILVVLGLAIEFGAGLKASLLARTKLGILTERAKAAFDKSASAEKDAGDSKVLAARIGTTNEQLSLQIEELRSNNLVLQSELQPRRITPTQMEDLTNCLMHCPKGKFFVSFTFLDAESAAYANDITEVLRSTGFEVEQSSNILGGIPPGVHIVAKDLGNVPMYAGLAQRCFVNCGIKMAGLWGEPGFDTNKIEIEVGPHF